MSQGVCNHSTKSGQSEYVLVAFKTDDLYKAFSYLYANHVDNKSMIWRKDGVWSSAVLMTSDNTDAHIGAMQDWILNDPVLVGRANARGIRPLFAWKTGDELGYLMETRLGGGDEVIKDIRTLQMWNVTQVSYRKPKPLSKLSRVQKLHNSKRNSAVVPGAVVA